MAGNANKPNATVTIEPTGQRRKVPRDHSIKVQLKLSDSNESKHADRTYAGELALRSLASFPPTIGKPDKRGLADVLVTGKVGKARTPTSIVVGVEASVIWPGIPAEDSVDRVSAVLSADGYRVAVRQKRECDQEWCTSEANVDWSLPAEVPPGWYSSKICGRHNYRTCSKCASIYVMLSSNSVGPAPSVHCEVCGGVIVEWGSSKVWSAELMTRGAEMSAPAGARH